jgi:hypothetical protein
VRKPLSPDQLPNFGNSDDLFDGALTDNLIQSLKEATQFLQESDSASPASSDAGEVPNPWAA